MPLIQFKGCNPCSLKPDWNKMANPVMPMTVPTSATDFRAIVIGTAPDDNEDVKGKPFIGKAGKYLLDFVPSQFRDKLYLQNVVRCLPNRGDPEPREIECCSTHLYKDIQTANPNVIIAAGSTAVNSFWPGVNVNRVRGLKFPVEIPGCQPTWVMPIFHPHYVLRAEREFEGKTTNSALPVFRNDIQKVFRNIETFSKPPVIRRPDKSKFIYPKSIEEARSLFGRLKEPFTIDIETFKKKPYLIDARILTAAFSDGDITFAFPVNWPGNLNPWGKEAFNDFMSSNRQWIAHNAGFELVWIWHTTKHMKQNFHCTEVLARINTQRRWFGELGDLTRCYLGFDIKSYSTLDVKRLVEYPVEKVLEYNCYDAWGENELCEKLIQQMPVGQENTYEQIIGAIRSVTRMELIGLEPNIEEAEKLEKELVDKMTLYTKQAQELAEVQDYQKKTGKQFQLSQPQAVGLVLAEYCGIELEKTGKSQQYSTDADLLEKFAGQHSLVDINLDYKEVQKQWTTYVRPVLTGEILGFDGLLHPSYTTVHTATFRLSSQDPNIQNWPKRKHREVRRLVCVPKGFILASYDYGQLEARTLVMGSNDEVLRKAFVNREDIHTKWLLYIVDQYPKYIDRLRDKTGERDDFFNKKSKLRKAARDIIKTDFVFASFYGSIAKSISTRTGIPLNICIDILAAFWAEYHGVRVWINERFREYNETGLSFSLTGRVRDEELPGNEPINNPIQGTGAEIVLAAQDALDKLADEVDIFFRPRINVHDDISFVLPEDSDLEKRLDYIGKEIVQPRFKFITVPLMTECKLGYNWCDLEVAKEYVGPYYSMTGQLLHVN